METFAENDEKTVKRSRSKHRAELDEEVLPLWDTSLTLENIARRVGCRQPTVVEIYKNHFNEQMFKERKRRLYQMSKLGERNPMTGKFNTAHHNYKGRASDCKGYYTVTTPNWADKKTKRMFEHHVIWLAFHRLTSIPKGCHIHHIDGDKGNNAISNLVCLTAQEHLIIHAFDRRCNDYGEAQYIQVDGSTSALLQREHEIVYSWRQRQAG